MEGVRRLILKGKSSKPIRAFLYFKDLKCFLLKEYDYTSDKILCNLNGKPVYISTEKDYSSMLNQSKLAPIEIEIPKSNSSNNPQKNFKSTTKSENCEIGKKRNSHPTEMQQPKKQIKSSAEIEMEPRIYSPYMCYGKFLRTFEIIDTRNDAKFTLKSDLFSKTSRALCLEKEVLVTGGRYDPYQVLSINISTREITQLLPLNVGRHWHVTGYIDGFPAVIGGVQGAQGARTAIKSVEVLKNGKWYEYPELNYARVNAGCSWVGKYTFVLWGSCYYNQKIDFRNDIEKWNGMTWEIINCKITRLFNPAFFAINSQQMLILGGLLHNEDLQNNVYLYDIDGNNWSCVERLKKSDCFNYNQYAVHGCKLHLNGCSQKHTIYSLEKIISRKSYNIDS